MQVNSISGCGSADVPGLFSKFLWLKSPVVNALTSPKDCAEYRKAQCITAPIRHHIPITHTITHSISIFPSVPYSPTCAICLQLIRPIHSTHDLHVESHVRDIPLYVLSYFIVTQSGDSPGNDFGSSTINIPVYKSSVAP